LEAALIKLGEIRELGQSVTRLTLPVLVEQTLITLMGVINTIMASRLGRETISAIGMIDAISLLIISFFGALAVGSTVTVAQYVGHNDWEKANGTAGQAIVSSFLIAAAVTLLILLNQKRLVDLLYGGAEQQVLLLSYKYLSIVLWSYIPIALVNIIFGVLRGAGDTRTPMMISILMNVANILFSYSLIYGLAIQLGRFSLRIPALGVGGAASGLLLARLFGLALCLYAIIRGSKLIKLKSLAHFKWQSDLMRCIFRLGIPASTEVLFFQVGKLIVQTFVVHLGTAVIAATAIAGSIGGLVMVPGSAISIAAMTLVGQQIGRGRPDEAKRQLKFLIGSATVAIGLISLLILPFLNGLISLYTDNQPAAEVARIMLLSYLIAEPLIWPAAFITPAGLRGAGDVRYTLTISLISMWLLRVLLAYVFTVWLPLSGLGIWLAMYCDWIARAIFFVGRLRGSLWHKNAIFARKIPAGLAEDGATKTATTKTGEVKTGEPEISEPDHL
jgi:putative MATE family efflux protein